MAELSFLLNGGASSKRNDRAKAQEEQKKQLPPPSGNELRVMSVQDAVASLLEYVALERVVISCCERWQALGYGPGRRQSAADAGALPAIVKAMLTHPESAAVQEKGCMAIANICSGTDENGMGRKTSAFDAGAIDAIVAAFLAHAEVPAVQACGAAAIGNICYAGDNSGLARKHAAFEAGAIAPIAAALAKFSDDPIVCENSCFAIGNLCRALGKVGGGAGGDGGAPAPEMSPIEEQLRQKEQGTLRKQAAADAGALESLVTAMKKHEGVDGIQTWGARALSIITYESTPLREQAKAAGAKMQWLMGLTEGMGAGIKAAAPVSKTGRPPQLVPDSGRRASARPMSAKSGNTVRGPSPSRRGASPSRRPVKLY